MPKRVIDRFDIEAEREGNAVVAHRMTINRTMGVGKGIAKQRRMHSSGEAKIECRTIKQRFDRMRYA